ncbi:hypothetical protein N9018_01895 [Rhodopirellula sp.]|nr:hypothetical protein [Rhodopirellula sp.]
MTRYSFELATPADDKAIRRVMAATPMAGSVTVSFQRDPNFFASNVVLGSNWQAVVCRDAKRNEVVGVATRSVRRIHVDGIPKRIGYLSGLRFMPYARRRGLLARGYEFVQRLHDVDPLRPDYYLTTIAEGNHDALEALTKKRASLPNYHFITGLNTLVFPIRRIRGVSDRNASVSMLSNRNDLGELIAFLNRFAKQRTFAPVYEHSDFQASGTFREMSFGSIAVIRVRGRIVGAAGLWDQHAFRQTIVRGYAGAIGSFRPFLNFWSKLTGGIQLPAVGQPLHCCYVAFPMVQCAKHAMMLLNQLIRMAPVSAGCLLIGLCDEDPLLSAMRVQAVGEYRTRLYGVSLNRKETFKKIRGHGPCYLELGCL